MLFKILNLNDKSDQSYAAIDLGSNSFHMIIARSHDGMIHIVDRLKEMVRLSDGLDEKHRLNSKAQERALACLKRFGDRVKNVPAANLRAVGTNVLRRVDKSDDFLTKANEALGHTINVISGIEEARLIFLGVVNSLDSNHHKRLVVDIGGGSTELITGSGYKPIRMESLYMGCVSMTMRFFPQGEITSLAFKQAEIAARVELSPIVHSYKSDGWDVAIGTSGTIQAVKNVVNRNGWCEHGISYAALKKLVQSLKKAGHTDNVRFDGLSKRRTPVFIGGVVVLYSIFKALKIDHMVISDGALREGVLYDLIGRTQHKDVRTRSAVGLAKRFNADLKQAERMEITVLNLASKLVEDWKFDLDEDGKWLVWASKLHEIGLSIAHSQYHVHGAYIVQNADLPGFSQQEQSILAFIVQYHRRKLSKIDWSVLPPDLRNRVLQYTVLFRLGFLLHRSRDTSPLPDIEVHADAKSLKLIFPVDWLDEQPLTQAGLKQEAAWLKAVDFNLEYR